MTSYHGMAHQGDVGNGEDVVIHGLGGVRLSTVQIADASGANVIGVDIRDKELDKADSLDAMSDFGTMGIPVVGDFTA